MPFVSGMNPRTTLDRRAFLVTALVAGSSVLASAQPTPPSNLPAQPVSGTEPKRKAPLELPQVKEFVVAGHGNLPKVKEMLSAEPMLINAAWDWGAGDWETAIGGAAHTGNRELALHLLDAGSRFDLYSAAMLDEVAAVTALLQLHPALANTRGPHGFTLLYHVGYSGNPALAETVARGINPAQRSRHFNQALQSAVSRGHTDLTAYLLDHGVDDPNSKNFQGKTTLDVALAKNHEAIIKLLRAHGAVTST